MRVKWWVGFMTVAVGAPWGAQAGTNKGSDFYNDYWYSAQSRGQEQVRVPLAAEAQSEVSVLPERAAIRPVDTFVARGFDSGALIAAAPRVVPITTPVTSSPTAPAAAAAAPEMNAGFAATGLTLLFAGVAILRGRRTRANV
jgi:hypothetical protein